MCAHGLRSSISLEVRQPASGSSLLMIRMATPGLGGRMQEQSLQPACMCLQAGFECAPRSAACDHPVSQF